MLQEFRGICFTLRGKDSGMRIVFKLPGNEENSFVVCVVASLR